MTKDVVLLVNETSTLDEALQMGRHILEACPQLNLWGVSLEKNAMVELVPQLRSLVGEGLRVVLPSREQEVLAGRVTKENVPWSSLVTQLTLNAPVIEELGDRDDDDEEEEEDEDEEQVAYDPLTAEGYVEASEEVEEEGKEAEKEGAKKEQGRQPRLVGRGSKGGSWKGQGNYEQEDDEEGSAGSYGAALDRTSW